MLPIILLCIDFWQNKRILKCVSSTIDISFLFADSGHGQRSTEHRRQRSCNGDRCRLGWRIAAALRASCREHSAYWRDDGAFSP